MATLLVVAIARMPPPHRSVRRMPTLARPPVHPMSIPYDRDARAGEDDRMDREDRRIARLAARELGRYAGIDPHEAWLIFHRVRALRRRGITAGEIRQRLDPEPR